MPATLWRIFPSDGSGTLVDLALWRMFPSNGSGTLVDLALWRMFPSDVAGLGATPPPGGPGGPGRGDEGEGGGPPAPREDVGRSRSREGMIRLVFVLPLYGVGLHW